MRRLIFRPLVLVSTFLVGLFVTFLLTSAADALSHLLYEPSESIPTLCRGVRNYEHGSCSQQDLYESEEAAVYSVVIGKSAIPVQIPAWVDHKVVIQDQTAWGDYLLTDIADGRNLDRLFEAFKRDFPLADLAALDNFLVVNQRPYPMLKHPVLAQTGSRLIRHEDVERFSKTDTGFWWAAFYRDYPEAAGFFTLSKVGFNADMTQAIVYRAFSCGDTCGYGSYVLLVKAGGAWRIVGEARPWVS